MFFKSEDSRRKKKGLPDIVRVFMSLIMLSIFGLGMLQAYTYFSGVNPRTVDPKTLVVSLLTSEQSADLVKSLLSMDVPTIKDSLKKLIASSSTAGSASPDNSDQLTLGAHEDTTHSSGQPLFKFAIVTDTHNDNDDLQKALAQAKDGGAELVIGLGDYSDVGTLEELTKTKATFDDSGMTYYSTVGDHDLWDCRNRKLTPTCNFSQTFGSPYQAFSYKGVRFLLLYNSDNYEGVDGLEFKWLDDQFAQMTTEKPLTSFAMMQEPLYHPSSDHVMGKETPRLKTQADHLIELLSQNHIAEVFYGDTHFYSRYNEPKTNLKMTAVGAVTATRNAQKPRFVMVDVFDNGSYNVSDTEIK
jgi:hypothetical protein